MTRLKWRSKLTCDDAAPVGGAGRRPAITRRHWADTRRREADTRDGIRLGGQVICLLLGYPSWSALLNHVWYLSNLPFSLGSSS